MQSFLLSLGKYVFRVSHSCASLLSMLLVVGCLFLGSVGSALAATCVWVGPFNNTTSSWTNPANWSGGIIPGPGDVARFPNPNSPTGTVLTPYEIEVLTDSACVIYALLP